MRKLSFLSLIAEQLIVKGAQLFFLACELSKSKRFKYCWILYLRINIRERDKTSIEPQIHDLL